MTTGLVGPAREDAAEPAREDAAEPASVNDSQRSKINNLYIHKIRVLATRIDHNLAYWLTTRTLSFHWQ